MKKIFFLFICFACALSMQAKTIYLVPNEWASDGARFAIYAFDGGDATWVGMSTVTGQTSIYEAAVKDAYRQVIFCRMNGSTTENNWDNVWNQTSDQQIPADKNCFTFNGSWDGCDGKSCGNWSNYDGSGTPDPGCTNRFGLRIDGSTIVEAARNTQQTEWLEYMATGIALTAGQTVEIYNICASEAWAISNIDPAGCSLAISDNKYQIAEAGSYDFYIKMLGFGNDQIYIAKDGAGCGGGGGGGAGSAVPSQCTDVLMQGFYYDSYEVDSTHAGTLEYGDTKWKTLLAQAGEIGAYFDLIWLPPSGYASGVGYHPKQYSNQNSSWGSRTDLEKLIAAFHNSGTKVVADIVINHAEAMMSWCDMAVEDFGEYGKFEPGPTFITKGDEVNWPENNQDTLAGECWGYSNVAGARDDDGENWKDARDWAHGNPEVQEMFKAYLKWMKNVMKYDGWRYNYPCASY